MNQRSFHTPSEGIIDYQCNYYNILTQKRVKLMNICMNMYIYKRDKDGICLGGGLDDVRSGVCWKVCSPMYTSGN